MPLLVRDSGGQAKDFCFQMFPAVALQSRANRAKGLLRPLTIPSRQASARTFGAIMTSISAASLNNYQSPLQLLQNELQSEVSSGAISSSDESALSSALTDINSSLQSSQSNAQSNGTQSSPGDLKSRIDSLIAGEVSSGKLTSDQATELQNLFQSTFGNGPGGAGGPGGPGGAGGPPPGGPPPSDSSSSSTATDGSSDDSSVAEILQQFLQSLQSSSSISYSPTGTNATGSSSTSVSALLIDYQS
jgi:hypothetical protein